MKRLALVTGGTRGIGMATALRLKNSGYSVIITQSSNKKDVADRFLKEHNIPVYGWDVGDFDACVEGVQKIQKEIGNIEILVHGAGITKDALLHKMDKSMWDNVIKTNLSSCFYMTSAVINSMYTRQFGRIILISSVNGLKGQRGQTNYCASKAGIIGFMKALAYESIRYGVTVNAIAPGYTDTDMVRAIPEPMLGKIIEQIPIKRLGKPEEIARCIEFLASSESDYITGHTFHINGGLYMA